MGYRKFKDGSVCDCGCEYVDYTTYKHYNEKTHRNEVLLDRMGCPECLKEINNDGDLQAFLNMTVEYTPLHEKYDNGMSF